MRRLVPRRPPLPLALLLALAFAHALAWIAVQPPLTGADEDLHVGYVQALVETGDGPSYGEGSGTYSTEVQTLASALYLYPIILHPEARPAWGLVDRVDERLRELPPAAKDNTTGPNTAAANPPLYYAGAAVAWELWPDRSLPGRIFGARLLTALLLPICVWLAWLIAAQLFAAAWIRPVFAGIVAFNPKLANSAAVVNPDILLATLATGSLLAALLIVRHGWSPARLAGLGLTAGGAALTHPRGLYLVPFSLGVVALAAFLQRDEVRGWWRDKRVTRAIVGGVTALVAMFVCVGAAYAWTRSHAGSGAIEGATPAANGLSPREFLSYVWLFYLPGYEFFTTDIGQGYGYRQVFIRTFFGAFGSLDVHFQEITYSRFQVGAFLGLVALYTTIVLRFRTLLRSWPVVFVLVLSFLGLVGEMHLVSYSALRGGANPAITGRYLVPGIALFAAAICWVIVSLPRRFGLVAGGGILGLALVHATGALGVALERYFG